MRHSLTEPGHPSNLTVHYGRTVDATNPEWVAKLLAVANRELSDGTVEFKIDSVNNVRKKLVLKAVPTAEQQALNETEAERASASSPRTFRKPWAILRLSTLNVMKTALSRRSLFITPRAWKSVCARP